MAAATVGSHWLWAAIWLGWSFFCFYVALRVVYLRQRRASAAAAPAADAGGSPVESRPGGVEPG
jgi:hypothetical protein